MAGAARTSATTSSRRRRPLQTCAASMSGIIDTAYEKTGSLGNFTKHLTRFATSTIPFASTVQNLGQTMISLTDDHIMFLERVTETVFPPAGRVFDKIDELVYSVIEDLPDRFDKATFNFIPLSIMHQIPFKLDWIVQMHLVWWFIFLISIVTHWGSRIVKEEDILIDMSFDPSSCSPKKTESEVQEKFMLISSSSEFATSENFDEALSGQSSMVSSNKFAESAKQEQNDEIQGQSMVLVGSHKFTESKEVLDEALDQESGNEFVESLDKENLDQEALGGQSVVVSDHQEPPLSPTESFVTAQYQNITSSSAAAGDLFLDEFEHVELPISTDEDENYKDNFIHVSKPLQVGSSVGSSDHSHVAAIASSSSSSKNKASRKKKAITKDKKNEESNSKDEHQILELLEEKWHMM